MHHVMVQGKGRDWARQMASQPPSTPMTCPVM